MNNPDDNIQAGLQSGHDDVGLTPKKARRGWLIETPHRQLAKEPTPDSSDQELPLLRLTHFTKKVTLSFDVVRTGNSRTRELLVENPCEFAQELLLEKFPYGRGFSMDNNRWEIDACELVKLPITWTPKDEGNVREMITFKCDGAFRLQVILLGSAEEPPRRRGPSFRRSTFSVHRKVPLKAIQPTTQLNSSRTTMVIKPKKSYQTTKPVNKRLSQANHKDQPSPNNQENQTLGKRKNQQPRDQENRHSFSYENQRPDNRENQYPDNREEVFPISGAIPTEVIPKETDAVHTPSLGLIRTDGSPESRNPNDFTALDSSLAEISGDGMPTTAQDLLIENLKRQTLPVCDGMSPLLLTSKRFVFAESAVEPTLSQTVEKGVSISDKVGLPMFTDSAVNTVTKSEEPRASDCDQDHKSQTLIKNLFFAAVEVDSSPLEFDDSLNEPKVNHRPVVDDGPISTDVIGRALKPKVQPLLQVSDKPSIDSNQADKQDPVTVERESFPIHQSVVTSQLLQSNRKRLSDQDRDDIPLPAIKKAKPEPKERPMNRTLALRKEAARKKAGPVSSAGHRGGQGRVSSSKPYKAKGPVKGVPMAKLNLFKTAGIASIPRHPMPFAAKNMFYDERWMEKQDRGFTRWLNHVLTPDDWPKDPSCKATKIDAGTIFIDGNATAKTSLHLAPSKEAMSLRTYTAKRKLNRLRRGACMLFQSEPVVRVIQKLEAEIEKGRLVVRVDRKLHADYGIKQKLLDLFLSYNPLWLRIGLETTYGEILPLQGMTDIIGLSRFIVSRLLCNPDIAALHAHPTVPHLYGPGYEEALSQFTLKKFLVLVLFLDRAKLTRLINHDPCLFCKDSEFKSSRDLLLHFSREYLRGEGDLTKHLSYMGYVVTHRQRPLDEFDFSVANLSTDLRCGVRLARVAELLIHDWTLSSQLRVPAVSRLQKIHNVETMLKTIKLDGCSVDARSIVDGHREKTLNLLWRIIFQFQIGLLLDEKQLKKEVAYLRTNLRLKKDLSAMNLLTAMSDREDRRRLSNEPNVYFKSSRLSLLLKWCQVVCSYYGLKVENFTVSFSDGRALCYLVHHYHPSILPLGLIRDDTTQTQYQSETPEDRSDDSFDGSSWANVYSPSTGKPGERDKLLDNERQNFKVLYDKVAELGGVPGVVRSAEMSNTIPDEKVVITYVSYLCARLLDLRTETRAARSIQIVWRAHRLRSLRKHKQIQHTAAVTIQRAVHSFLRGRYHKRLISTIIRVQALRRGVLACREVRGMRQAVQERCQYRAAVTVQAYFKGCLARIHYAKTLKAVKIQATFRGYAARKDYLRKRQAVITLQSAVRRYRTRQRYNQQRRATVILQRRFRAAILGRGQLAVFHRQRRACIILQSALRGYQCRQRYRKVHTGITSIQALFRARVLRRRYLRMKEAALAIQRYWRSIRYSRSIREEYLNHRRGVIAVQSLYRGMRARRYAAYLRSVVKMQAVVRGFTQRRKYNRQREACITIQRYTRGRAVRKGYGAVRAAVRVLQGRFRAKREGRAQRRVYVIKRKAAIVIQAWVRGSLVREELRVRCSAAVCIQSTWKMRSVRRRYVALLAATRRLQGSIRTYLVGKAARRDFLKLRSAAVFIQSRRRGLVELRKYRRLRVSCTVLQSFARMVVERKRYCGIRRAAVTVQRLFRAQLHGDRQRKEYCRVKKATVTIQAHYRGVTVRRLLARQHRSAVLIQSVYRSSRDRRNFTMLRSATITLQRRARARLIGKQIRRDYLTLKSTVVFVQSLRRAALTRSAFLEKKQAVIKIQSLQRMRRAREHYRCVRQAAVTIQIRYHATKNMQWTRLEYQVYRGACITLQAGVRGLLVRREMHLLHTSAVRIQTLFRSYRMRTKYHKMRQAAIVLQRYWRATCLAKQTRRHYDTLRTSAVILQATYRGKIGRQLALQNRSARVIQTHYRRFVVQRCYRQQKAAAIRIQATVRRHQARSHFTNLRRSAIIILTRYRAQRTSQIVQLQYQIRRGACITLQAGFRGLLVRREIRRLRTAATKIQTFYRARSIRALYFRKRRAALVLQGHWRAKRLGGNARDDYTALRKATVILQSVHRGRLGRRIALRHRSARLIQSYYRMHVKMQFYNQLKRAAVKIQTVVRSYYARQRCTSLRRAAVIIQGRYRAKRLAGTARLSYLTTRAACVTLQSLVRGHLVRQQIQRLHTAATTIQKNYKAHLAHSRYGTLRRAVGTLQTRWRSTVTARVQQRRYRILQLAAVTLQSAYRGQVGRERARRHRVARTIQAVFRMRVASRKYSELRAATCTIQSYYRTVAMRRRYLLVVRSARLIQNFYRACRQTEALRATYLRMRTCAVKVQAVYRGFAARRRFLAFRRAITRLQAVYKGKRQQRAYKSMRAATVRLQVRYRAHVLRNQHVVAYSIQRGAAITIQSTYRGWVARQEYLKMKVAATTIQAVYRGHRLRLRLQCRREATLTLQRRYRGHLLTKTAVAMFQTQQKAVRTIQAYYRGYTTRRRYVSAKAAATVIQSLYRAAIQRRRYRETREAVVVLQRRYRARLLQRDATWSYHVMRGAAITIQAWYRGALAKEIYRRAKAARTVQKHFRGYLVRRHFQTLRKATRLLQVARRGVIQRRSYLKLKTAAVVVQTRYRALRDGRVVRRRYLNQRSAAITLQSIYRGHRTRRLFAERRQSVIVLQRSVRGLQQRERYRKIRRATRTLQIYFRTAAVGRKQRRAYLTLRQAAIRIQSYYRMSVQRRRYLQLGNAASIIAANFKGLKVRRDYLELKRAVESIQMRYRATRLALAQRRHYHVIRAAVITIQSYLRGFLARRLARRIRAAVKIQSLYKAHVQQRSYERMRSSIIYLQAFTRGMMTRREVAVQRRCWESAVCIQRHYRRYVVRKRAEAQRQVRLEQLRRFSTVAHHHLSAIRLQRCYRMYRMRQAAKAQMDSILVIQLWMRSSLQRLQFLKLRRGIIALQRLVRRRQYRRQHAALCLQSWARVWLARRRISRMQRGALRIQSFWRGLMVRRGTKDKKIAAARARCMKANRSATEDKKLCNLMASALDYLLKYRQMCGLLEALSSLVVVTRLSASCCQRLVEAGAVPVIFTLIRSCNRSLPCTQVVTYGVSILLNLAKHPPTAIAVFDEPESMATILDLMQMYRDKCPVLFIKVCMLMGTLAQQPRRAKMILSLAKNKERLLALDRLMQRKYTMNTKRALAKSRGLMNASSLATPSRHASIGKVKPDWVLGSGRMQEITEPMKAWHFVMDTLKLP